MFGFVGNVESSSEEKMRFFLLVCSGFEGGYISWLP